MQRLPEATAPTMYPILEGKCILFLLKGKINWVTYANKKGGELTLRLTYRHRQPSVSPSLLSASAYTRSQASLAGGGCGFRQPLRPHFLRLYWVGTGLSAALGSTVHHSSRVSSSLLIPIYEISGKIQVVSSMSLQGIVCIRDAAIYVLRHKVPSGMWQPG